MPESSDFNAARPANPGSKAASRPPAPAPASRQLPSWAGIAALVLSLVAIVLAIIGWFRPSTTGSYNDQQRADAKQSICSATNSVRRAVEINTNLTNPAQSDPAVGPIGGLAVAANARLALDGGGTFLLHRLEAESATPKDLNQAVTAYAHTLQELGINYLAGAMPTDSVQQPLRDNLRTQIGELNELCQGQ